MLHKNSTLRALATFIWVAVRMTTPEKAINYCVFCKKLLSKTDTKILCTPCRKKTPNFTLSIETTPDDVERIYKDVMIYCYNCGGSLLRTEDSVICVDGCELVDIDLDTASAPSSQQSDTNEPAASPHVPGMGQSSPSKPTQQTPSHGEQDTASSSTSKLLKLLTLSCNDISTGSPLDHKQLHLKPSNTIYFVIHLNMLTFICR